ncbi:MAG: M42 family metallopeptidase [Clostridia bacterium]|nr:M42 family metallopeptidase [Clostridia bacterium]MBQ9803202.1 M42 family metallopeptidase [Clostridia bacterium]
MDFKIDTAYMLQTMQKLIETPSPVGYYTKMKPVIEHFAAQLGYTVTYDNRNTAYITVAGEDHSKTVCLSAHADTLGLMVRGINADGTLRVRAVGGLHFISCEGENVTLHTRGGKTYTGLLICTHHSSHAFDDAKSMPRDENTCAVLLDEPVKTAADVRALGIGNGDYISVDPRFTVTENGYIKSRFIDNKAAMACAFAVLKYLSENKKQPKFDTVFAFPFYEEIGYGGACVPQQISEYVAVDIAILGPDADGDERGVTICAKDAAMPYDYDLTNRLIDKATRAGCRCAVDLFYRYGSDASQAIKGGNDVRHAAFGMAVYCSHGVERTHIAGIENTTKLMLAYVLDL